jgi:hypothetical protein
MAIEDLIAQGPRPPQVEDMTTAAARGLTLANSMQERQLRQLQMQGVQQENQQRQMQLDQTRALNQAYQGALSVDADGKPTIDRGKLTNALSMNGHGSAIPGILKSLNEYDQSNATLLKTRGELADQETLHAGELGAAVRQAGYDPRLFLTLGSDAVRQGHVPAVTVKPMFDQLQQALAQDPTGESAKALSKQFTDQLIAQSPKQRELDSAQMTAQSRADTAKTGSARLNLETPGIQAKTEQELRTNTVAKLATATTPAAYTRMYDAVTNPDLQKTLPAPEQWDPKNTPAQLLRMGMTPAEQQRSGQEKASEAERVRHNKADEGFTGQRVGIAQQANELKKVEVDPFGALGINKPPATAQPGATAPPAAAPITGEPFLARLPPPMAARVSAIADGRETLSAREKGTPSGRALIGAVEQYDPKWSEQRAQLRKAFTAGPDGRNIGNLNTAPVHLDQLADAAKAMQNGTFVPGNRLYNAVSTMFGGTAPTNFEGMKTVVAGEMASAMKGNATDPEIASFNKSVNSASSPGQLADVISKVFLPALGAKLNTYSERYHAQSPDDQWTPVLPSARAVFGKYGIDPSAGPAAPAGKVKNPFR